jgi:predicted nucleic acid-binding Zn ribbon protein
MTAENGVSDADISVYERECDYCCYQYEDIHAPEDEQQNPCPECEVVPTPQLRPTP